MERREVLKEGWRWFYWAVAAAVLYPLFRFLGFKVPRKPRRVEVHKSLKVTGFIIEHDFIIFAGAHGPWAVSRKCTHLGCRLNYQENEKILLCPCHQSRFTVEGKRVAGPARLNLTIFPVTPLSGEGDKGYLVTL
ncbi:MAG: ubiquinol-cytochrome c reductase iron-sulfur subunit [Desulfobulbaceae bacterium]|nr:ubiquinol-cytochrome c reductase iron-sulfur subunit [Desulfobulbaceae bacterium]